MVNITKIVGSCIKSCRNKTGLTQEDLAELCNMHPTYIAKIESGRQTIKLTTLHRIAKALHLPIQSLLGPVIQKQSSFNDVHNKYLKEILISGSKAERDFIFTSAEVLLKKRKKR